MSQLAIKGHPTRGKEVIEILKMLGGQNYSQNLLGGTEYNYYYIGDYSTISCIPKEDIDSSFVKFTLEQFLEKFPYKVGDKVIYEDKVREVTKMVWEEHTNTVAYKLDDKLYCNVIKELQLCKEETMEELRIDFPEGYGYAGIENKQVIFTKIKPQYPKTYEECCEVLGYDDRDTYCVFHTLADERLFETLYLLKVCRNAYWKVAEGWSPDFTNKEEKKFTILFVGNEIYFSGTYVRNCFLAFPTAEMRDAFCENFKELIEQCKEVL